MSVNRAVAIAAATDQTELRSLYGRQSRTEPPTRFARPRRSCAYGTLRLLTLATLRIPDLYLYTHLLEALDEDPTIEPVPPLVTSQLGEIAAGTLRLAHRALETTRTSWARDRRVGRAGARARPRAAVRRSGARSGAGRWGATVAIALTRAIAATAREAMLVPGELADALARLLVLYLIATTVG